MRGGQGYYKYWQGNKREIGQNRDSECWKERVNGSKERETELHSRIIRQQGRKGKAAGGTGLQRSDVCRCPKRTSRRENVGRMSIMPSGRPNSLIPNRLFIVDHAANVTKPWPLRIQGRVSSWCINISVGYVHGKTQATEASLTSPSSLSYHS